MSAARAAGDSLDLLPEFPARRKRHSQGNKAGKRPGRTDKGPSGSSNQPGTRHIRPGTEAGTISLMPIPPALPEDAPSPSRSRSTTVTLWPSA